MSSKEYNTKTQRHQDTKSEDDISHQIIGAVIEAHRTLGGQGYLRGFMNLHDVMNLYLED